MGVLQPVADERWTHACSPVQGCLNGAVQPHDGLGGGRAPCSGAVSRKAAIGASCCSSGCPSSGGLAAWLSASAREPQRAHANPSDEQPNGHTAGNKRLLSLSVGWLLDRGFM